MGCWGATDIRNSCRNVSVETSAQSKAASRISIPLVAGKSLDISAHLRVLGRLVRLRFEMSRPLFLVPAPHLAGWPLLWHAIRMSVHRGVGLDQDAHLLCNLSSELITGPGLLRGYGLSLRCPGIGFPMSFQCVAQTLSNLAFRC